MSIDTIQRAQSRNDSQLSFKQKNLLSTLTNYKNAPSILETPRNNLSQLKTIEITEKVRQKIIQKNTGKWKRNQSLGNILSDDLNPENIQTSRALNPYQENNQIAQERKTNKFFSMINGAKSSTKNYSTMTKLDMGLPSIQTKKPQVSTKKANYLQIWLDEALDPQDLQIKELKETELKEDDEKQKIQKELEKKNNDNSFLSTVKKYNIDRQYLKSQNIPNDIIQRLYNTLYIYTHGINNVFNELLSFVKASTEEQPRDNKILNHFWKCFIKLLEGCTSFQTTFQKIEQTHLAKISELREIVGRRQQIFLKQKQELNIVISKIQKTNLELNNEYEKLQNDNRVTISTLELTDQAFNEQVQLRLKFQEKINHVYTSYEQLRTKYLAMMAALNIQNQQTMNHTNQQNELNDKIRRLQGDLQQHKHQLSHQISKVKERQEQINVKKQQFNDLQKQYHIKLENQRQEDDVMEIQVNKNNMLKTKVTSLENRIQLMQNNSKETYLRLKDQNQKIQMYRKANQQLHQKLNQMGKNIAQYELHKVYQQSQIVGLTSALGINNHQLQIITQQKKNIQSRFQLVTEQLQQKKYEVQTKLQAIQKIKQTINDLKATKDKYQCLYKIIIKQKESIEKERNAIQEKYSLQRQEIIGLKMLQENKQKQIRQMQAKNDKEKQLLKRKITGYNETLTKKQSLILNYQKIEEQKNDHLLNKTYRIEKLQKELTDQKNLHQRKVQQNQYLFKKIQEIQVQLGKVNTQLKLRGSELEDKLKEYHLSAEQLQAARNLLNLLQEQRNSSITNLTSLYQQYRQLINRKGQHIHPLLYEDLSAQFNRIKLETIPKMQKQMTDLSQLNQTLKAQNISLQSIIAANNSQIDHLKEQLSIKEHQIQAKTQQVRSLNLSKLSLEKTLSKQTLNISSLNEQLKTKQIMITEQNKSLESISADFERNKSSLKAKQVQIQKLSNSLSIVSDKLFSLEGQTQSKQKNNSQLVKMEKLESELQLLNKELEFYRNVIRNQQEVQTDPEDYNQAVISKLNPGRFDRKNKFANNPGQRAFISADKQVQTLLTPFDSIPHYIDTKIAQIKRQELIRQAYNESKLSYVLRSREEIEADSGIKQVATKISSGKAGITRRQQLRKALRFTYMRR